MNKDSEEDDLRYFDREEQTLADVPPIENPKQLQRQFEVMADAEDLEDQPDRAEIWRGAAKLTEAVRIHMAAARRREDISG